MPAPLLWYLVIGSILGVGNALLIDQALSKEQFDRESLIYDFKMRLERDLPFNIKAQYRIFRGQMICFVALATAILYPILLLTVILVFVSRLMRR